MRKHATARVVWGHAPEKILRFRGYAIASAGDHFGPMHYASWSPEDRFSHSCTMTKINDILWASLVRAETRQTLRYNCMYYLSGINECTLFIVQLILIETLIQLLNQHTIYIWLQQSFMLLSEPSAGRCLKSTTFTGLNRYRLKAKFDLNSAFSTVIQV